MPRSSRAQPSKTAMLQFQQPFQELQIVPSWKPGDRPPPASRPYALLPGLFTQGPWGVSQSTLEEPPASPPNPLLFTLLPPCPSSRLSCYPMPFLQRYGAADLLDAALQLYRWLGHALMAAFGISSCRGELLPCPIAALDADALLRVAPFHPLFARVCGRAALVRPFASQQVNIGTQIDVRAGRHVWVTCGCVFSSWCRCLGVIYPCVRMCPSSSMCIFRAPTRARSTSHRCEACPVRAQSIDI
jgi:hypothetical protein